MNKCEFCEQDKFGIVSEFHSKKKLVSVCMTCQVITKIW